MYIHSIDKGRLLKCGKHLHDRIIPPRGEENWVIKHSLNPPLFIAILSQKVSGHVFVC